MASKSKWISGFPQKSTAKNMRIQKFSKQN